MVIECRVWYLLTIFYITLRDVPFGGDFTQAARHQGIGMVSRTDYGRQKLSLLQDGDSC